MTPLRQRMLEDMGIRNLATNTQSSYLQQVSAFAKHFGQSPDELGPEEIRAWLDSLAQFSDKIPPLPETISREWLYQDHN